MFLTSPLIEQAIVGSQSRLWMTYRVTIHLSKLRLANFVNCRGPQRDVHARNRMDTGEFYFFENGMR
jgi:hypothetical protein